MGSALASLIFLVLRVLLGTDHGQHKALLCALFVFVEIALTLGMLQFWTLDCLYILVEGQVRVSRGEEELSICQSPDTLGELAVLGEKPRSADCKALTDVLALRIKKEEFSVLLDERPEMARGLIKVLLKYAG